MLSRFQSASIHPNPFESTSKDPDDSIRSVCSIVKVEHHQRQEQQKNSFNGEEQSPLVEVEKHYQQQQLPCIVENPPHLLQDKYKQSIQTVLSLRDMYEYESEHDRNSSDICGLHDGRKDDQPFALVHSVNHQPLPSLMSDQNSNEWSRNQTMIIPSNEPPLTTLLSPKTLPSTQQLIDRNESPPTPLARSPSSFTDLSAVKQIALAPYIGHSIKTSPTFAKASTGMGPVLYSAIGSLEDPMTASSFSKRFEGKREKVEFPSLLNLSSRAPQNIKKYVPKTIVDVKDSNKSAKSTSIAPSVSSKKIPSTVNQDDIIRKNVDAESSKEPVESFTSKTSKKQSSIRNTSRDSPASANSVNRTSMHKKVVSIDAGSSARPSSRPKPRHKKQASQTELFRPSSDAYTPRMGKKVIKYKDPEMRTPMASMASPLGTLQRPNFRDALRRVAMILHQHVVKIEHRFESSEIRKNGLDDGLFRTSMRNVFSEEAFATPTYRCTMVRVPMARPGMIYGLRRLRTTYTIPSEAEIYEFAHRLFKTVQLSSECSIVCLIYVERLMEAAKVPLLSNTWRPIFMCGLLLASKVWQDLSSWNIEFAGVYPQYSLDSINRLELLFLRNVKWDLYISSSCYAKYYFALRSLVEKQDFRQRYNRMVGGVHSVQASEALKIEKRSTMVKEEALSQLSRSM